MLEKTQYARYLCGQIYELPKNIIHIPNESDKIGYGFLILSNDTHNSKNSYVLGCLVEFVDGSPEIASDIIFTVSAEALVEVNYCTTITDGFLLNKITNNIEKMVSRPTGSALNYPEGVKNNNTAAETNKKLESTETRNQPVEPAIYGNNSKHVHFCPGSHNITLESDLI